MDLSNNNAPDVLVHAASLTVERPTLEVTKGLEGCPEVKTLHYYKIPGTKMFLDIKDGSVVADDWANSEADETKRICKIARYEVDTDQIIRFRAALWSEVTSKYIVIGKDKKVGLDDTPMWFDVVAVRCNAMFKNNGLYLAYNTQTQHIVADESEFQFEELAANQDVSQADN